MTDEQKHEAIELRLPKNIADYIYEVAHLADVTPEQAASVIAVMAIRRYVTSDGQ